MSALEIFNFDESQVRVVMIDGDPWFVATDVAKILGYATAKDLIRRLEEEDKGRHSVPTPGGDQVVSVISEPGMFAAIFGSQVPGAQTFKRWLTHEVLPQLRKTGVYAVAMSPAEILVAQAQQFLRAEQEMKVLHGRVDEVQSAVQEVRAIQGQHIDQRDKSAQAYAQLNGLPTDHKSVNRLGRTAGIIGRSRGRLPSKIQHQLFGEVNTWPDEIWEAAVLALEDDE